MSQDNDTQNSDSNENETLIEFPCDFPIKVMGLSNEQVRTSIEQAIHTHTTDSQHINVSEQSSRTGKYTSYTVTLHYNTKAELDRMYEQFTKIDGVSMVL